MFLTILSKRYKDGSFCSTGACIHTKPQSQDVCTKKKGFSGGNKVPDLEDSSADSISDSFAVLPLLIGDDSEIGDDRLGIESELAQNNLVELNNLFRTRILATELILALIKQSLEPVEYRRRRRRFNDGHRFAAGGGAEKKAWVDDFLRLHHDFNSGE